MMGDGGWWLVVVVVWNRGRGPADLIDPFGFETVYEVRKRS
jgi:hypothetical protein